jgi:hypothetical protein
MKKIISAALASSILLAGCSKTAAVNAGKAFIACAEQDLGIAAGSSSTSLLDQVLAIIYNGGASWESDLAAMATTFGSDAIACAAQVAEQLFREATGSAAPSTSDAVETPHDRALKALATYAQGKKFK